jgi:hypothetical protein
MIGQNRKAYLFTTDATFPHSQSKVCDVNKSHLLITNLHSSRWELPDTGGNLQMLNIYNLKPIT